MDSAVIGKILSLFDVDHTKPKRKSQGTIHESEKGHTMDIKPSPSLRNPR